MDKLQFLLDSQEKFQKRLGQDFSLMDEKEKSEFLHVHGYFLIEEVAEMLRETPFHKPWKQYNWDKEKTLSQEELQKDEAIDALHFLINIFLALGMDSEEVIERYKEKNKLNYRRQEDSSLGYIK